MRLKNLDAHIREAAYVFDLDAKYSSWTQKQSVEMLGSYLLDESKEFLESLLEKGVEESFDELSDVLGRFVAILLKLEDLGYTMEEIFGERLFNKYKRRKPHIFEQRTLPSEEECRIWNEAKAKEDD